MENETPEFETPSASNKDMWLFLIVLDVIVLCVLGFFLYNRFSGQLFSPAAKPAVAVTETVEVVDAAPAVQDAKAAAAALYMEGLDAFNQDDLVKAKQLWLEAQQLDPSNLDVKVALSQLEEMFARVAAKPEEKQMAAEPVEETVAFPAEKTAAQPAEVNEPAPVVVPAAKQSILVTPVNGSKYRRVTFRWFEPAQKVAIVSGFTNRKPQALKQVGEYWETTLSIAPGTYKFLYIVDGKNTTDPYADQKDGRSVLVVQ